MPAGARDSPENHKNPKGPDPTALAHVCGEEPRAGFRGTGRREFVLSAKNKCGF